MRLQWASLLTFLLAFSLFSSSPAHAIKDDGVPVLRSVVSAHDAVSIAKRDGHGHHHLGAPLVELNETEVLLDHLPTPPSYYTIDWEDVSSSEPRQPGLIMTHAILLGIAFFVALPIGIAIRSARCAAHSVVMLAFYVLCILGISASALYNRFTPNMYQGSKHATSGYILLSFVFLLSVYDLASFFRRLIGFVQAGEKHSLKTFWDTVILGRGHDIGERPDRVNGASVDDYEEQNLLTAEQVNILASSWVEHSRLSDESSKEWVHQARNHSEGSLLLPQSPSSDGTLHEHEPHHRSSKLGLLHRLGKTAFTLLERLLVFGGYFEFITGIVIYTGGCRGTYINGCLAHLIKGSIFWCFGLFTFARFLGSFAEYGWAWNKPFSSNCYSAEFVESLVIFLYGATNMWMERFGALPGDPFTTKQIQHISIAVMFCFAGLIGMGIESHRIRNWLAASTSVSFEPSRDSNAEPLRYMASFNPFPALVIGVTGAAMAAHAQTYLFQVQIHQLWGNLLVAFSVLRCLTYCFLWLGPPRSFLPSRPPTEALGSFFLACGGLVFMFSTEEVTLAAMRRGRDDVMMFLNVAVAVTCLAFCWTLFVVGFKGWINFRDHHKAAFHSSA